MSNQQKQWQTDVDRWRWWWVYVRSYIELSHTLGPNQMSGTFVTIRCATLIANTLMTIKPKVTFHFSHFHLFFPDFFLFSSSVAISSIINCFLFIFRLFCCFSSILFYFSLVFCLYSSVFYLLCAIPFEQNRRQNEWTNKRRKEIPFDLIATNDRNFN